MDIFCTRMDKGVVQIELHPIGSDKNQCPSCKQK